MAALATNRDIRCEGWLWKKRPTTADSDKSRLRRASLGLFRNNDPFQRRWFVLRAGSKPFQKDILFYYETPPQISNEKARGSISTSTILDVQKHEPRTSTRRESPVVSRRSSAYESFKLEKKMEYAFEVQCDKRVFMLGASSESDRDMWIRALTQSRKLKGPTASAQRGSTDREVYNGLVNRNAGEVVSERDTKNEEVNGNSINSEANILDESNGASTSMVSEESSDIAWESSSDEATDEIHLGHFEDESRNKVIEEVTTTSPLALEKKN